MKLQNCNSYFCQNIKCLATHIRSPKRYHLLRIIKYSEKHVCALCFIMIIDEGITTLTQCFVDCRRYSARTNAGMEKKVFVEYAACLHYKSNKLYGIKHSFCSHNFFVSPSPSKSLRILLQSLRARRRILWIQRSM